MDDEFLKKLNERLDKEMIAINRTPVESMDNLCPEDMSYLLYSTFTEQSPIQYKKNLPNELFLKIPFFHLLYDYLKIIDETGHIKLTPKGNLQVKLVKQLYALEYIKDYAIESEITKLSKESDSISIQNIKIIADISGITKKVHNKRSLTKAGKKLLDNKSHFPLFKKIFETYVRKFNWGYHDGYQDNSEIQRLFGFSLYLFLKYGKEERLIDFYVEKNLLAFPMLMETFFDDGGWGTPQERYKSCYSTRVIKRFLSFFNFIDSRKERIEGVFNHDLFVKNNLITKVFEIDNSKFKFIKTGFTA